MDDTQLQINLIKAIRQSDYNLLEQCINAGADLKDQDSMVLDMSISENNFEMLRYLVEQKKLDPKTNFRCLRNAAQENNVEIMKYLVDKCQVDIMERNYCAMKCAIMYDSLDAVKYLHSKGLSLNLHEKDQGLKLKNALIPDGEIPIYLQECWYFSSIKCLKWFFQDQELKEDFINSDILGRDTFSITKFKKNENELVSFVLHVLNLEFNDYYQKIKEITYVDIGHEDKIYLDRLYLSVEIKSQNNPISAASKKQKI